MDDFKFNVEFLEEANDFLESLGEKERVKIIYNIWKARTCNDKELFKKLKDEIWEFRTLYNRTHFRLFAFWEKTGNTETVVIATHGIIKKTEKTPKSEIEKAEKLREKYFNNKNKK